ncbi:hypothetical protein J0B02_13275 [Enterobacteriaceae bacterium YMB-R22]|nr:hypothetical protein [Tenebrionicola larvae]MBV4413777.1 hypothetical protein [Tenebrionicola larvae]
MFRRKFNCLSPVLEKQSEATYGHHASHDYYQGNNVWAPTQGYNGPTPA